MSLPLHLRGVNVGLLPGLYKILGIEEALRQQFASNSVLIDLRDGPDVALTSLAAFGYAGIVAEGSVTESPLPVLHSLSIAAAIGEGDAVRVHADGKLNVLYRRGANANTLFVTERCNSLCLMCSQPPRDVDDRWRVQELIDLLPLIDRYLAVLGVTGGEPTLLGDELLRLLSAAKSILPSTKLHVLTNGRTFSDPAFTTTFDSLRDHVTWAVPVYADVARIHDFVVQAGGAFVETIHGLHNLAERGHRIEIRTVLHAQTLPRIYPLAQFIYRNLPFVDHIALMGLEPMGLSRVNAALLDHDHARISRQLAPAVSFLHQTGMNVSIYNVPLCALDTAMRPFARKSISDWKAEYADDCSSCAVQGDCCGFFRSSSAKARNLIARPIGERAA